MVVHISVIYTSKMLIVHTGDVIYMNDLYTFSDTKTNTHTCTIYKCTSIDARLSIHMWNDYMDI